MQEQRTSPRRPSTLTALALGAVVAVAGIGALGLYVEAFLPSRSETPIVGQLPEVPEKGWYRPAEHGADLSYWGRRYEVVGPTVELPENLMSAAGDSEEDVVIYFRNDHARAAKTEATYPRSGRVGTAGAWNRDASEHAGGGAGTGPYPDDRGPLYVRVGQDQYRMIRSVGQAPDRVR